MPPRLTPVVDRLPETVPFVGPESIARTSGVPLRARIGANENPFGPSPAALAAMRAAAAESWHYGDPENHHLREAIAAHHRISAAAVMPGEGVDAILGMAVRLYAPPGSTVVSSLGGYPTFHYHVAGYGAALHTVPFRGVHEDIEALAAAAHETHAAMVYLANPDNPMGSWWDAESVERFVAAVPETTMIVLDEAYGEFAPAGTLPPFDLDRRNLLRMRTFSKAYGLAGIRVGYAVADPSVVTALSKVHTPFSVNSLAQTAAVASLAAANELLARTEGVVAERERVHAALVEAGYEVPASAANFLWLPLGERSAAFSEAAAEAGVVLRNFTGEGTRVTIGDPHENDLFLDFATGQGRALAGIG